jgi:quercetin dioxygenase-like cupin family protein
MISRSTVEENGSTLGVGSFAPGAVSDPLRHEVEELLYVIEGEGELRLDGEAIRFAQGDALLVPAEVWHWIANTGRQPVRTVFVFPHPDYPATERRVEGAGAV